MHRVILRVKDLALGPLKYQIAPENGDFAAQRHTAALFELGRKPRIVEPHGPDIAGLVSQNGLGRFLSSEHGLTSFPSGQNGCLVVTGGELRDLANLSVVGVAIWKQIDEVADRADADVVQSGLHLAPDALHSGNFVVHLQGTIRRGRFSGLSPDGWARVGWRGFGASAYRGTHTLNGLARPLGALLAREGGVRGQTA